MPIDRQSIPRPVFRNLRVFAVDPGMTARFETAVMNETTLQIPWEELEPGPSGEYVVVVDQDEQGKTLYPPVDLDLAGVLSRDGLPPSDGSPQFRQQMVYAVAMRTIKNFERALGRVVHWPPVGANRKYRRQISLYPHFMEETNAYYDPSGGQIRFGYFESPPESPFPGTIVFSCLSQDVIAHQVTHAILMGLNIEFDLDSPNRDVAALHEGFSDLIALFQHFPESDVLRQQIGAIRRVVRRVPVHRRGQDAHADLLEKLAALDLEHAKAVAGHVSAQPGGLHFPALPALKMAWISAAERARLKISTSSNSSTSSAMTNSGAASIIRAAGR